MNSGHATRRSLCQDFERIGLGPGDAVFVHAALRQVGPIIGGPDTLIDALRDAVGPEGTILGYADWQGEDAQFADPELRDDIPPFNPQTSRSIRDNGAFPELLRTTPGALRSASPGASCVALGGRADYFIADHALDYGYGPDSPFGELVAADGKVLMLGAPLDRMTLLHHAEHLANIPNKLVKRYETPILVGGEIEWRWFEEFETGVPVIEGLPEDYFATIVEAFLATGQGKRDMIGDAASVLVPAPAIVRFGVEWLEERFTGSP